MTVVVVSYDQQADVERSLAALGVQRGLVELVEVIVADDGSPTPPRLPASIGDVPVELVRQPDRGFRAAAARNLGARRARGDVLVFLDGDTVPGIHTIARLAALPSVVPDAVVVGRRHHYDLERLTPDEVVAWLGRRADSADDSDPGDGPPALGDPNWFAATRAPTSRAAGAVRHRDRVSRILALRMLVGDVDLEPIFAR